MSVRKLLLQFSSQSLLNLVISVQRRNRDEDDNSLLAARNLEFSSRLELQKSELSLQVSRAVLKVEESLGNLELQFGRLLVDDLVDGRHGALKMCGW